MAHAYGYESGHFTVYLNRLPVPMTASAGDAAHLTVALTVDNPAGVALGTVRLGDGNVAGIPIAVGEDGAPLTSVQDVNGDGVPELVLKFRRAALRDGGSSSSVLVLHADLVDGRQVEGVTSLAAKAGT